MKVLKELTLFLCIFIGGFVLLSLIAVLIFPISWNETVTFPGWILIYFILGGLASGCVVSEWDNKD